MHLLLCVSTCHCHIPPFISSQPTRQTTHTTLQTIKQSFLQTRWLLLVLEEAQEEALELELAKQ